jgi:hypothetical protein
VTRTLEVTGYVVYVAATSQGFNEWRSNIIIWTAEQGTYCDLRFVDDPAMWAQFEAVQETGPSQIYLPAPVFGDFLRYLQSEGPLSVSLFGPRLAGWSCRPAPSPPANRRRSRRSDRVSRGTRRPRSAGRAARAGSRQPAPGLLRHRRARLQRHPRRHRRLHRRPGRRPPQRLRSATDRRVPASGDHMSPPTTCSTPPPLGHVLLHPHAGLGGHAAPSDPVRGEEVSPGPAHLRRLGRPSLTAVVPAFRLRAPPRGRGVAPWSRPRRTG